MFATNAVVVFSVAYDAIVLGDIGDNEYYYFYYYYYYYY